jgi:hypothetical protein
VDVAGIEPATPCLQIKASIFQLFRINDLTFSLFGGIAVIWADLEPFTYFLRTDLHHDRAAISGIILEGHDMMHVLPSQMSGPKINSDNYEVYIHSKAMLAKVFS